MARTEEAATIYAQLGARIAAARNRKKWSQGILAKNARLTRGSVANIELGRQRPPLDTIWRIGAALGIEPRMLLPCMSELHATPELPSSDLPVEVEHYLSRLSDGETKIKALIRYARAELREEPNEPSAVTSKKKARSD